MDYWSSIGSDGQPCNPAAKQTSGNWAHGVATPARRAVNGVNSTTCLTWYTYAVYDWKWYSQTVVSDGVVASLLVHARPERPPPMLQLIHLMPCPQRNIGSNVGRALLFHLCSVPSIPFILHMSTSVRHLVPSGLQLGTLHHDRLSCAQLQLPTPTTTNHTPMHVCDCSPGHPQHLPLHLRHFLPGSGRVAALT